MTCNCKSLKEENQRLTGELTAQEMENRAYEVEIERLRATLENIEALSFFKNVVSGEELFKAALYHVRKELEDER